MKTPAFGGKTGTILDPGHCCNSSTDEGLFWSPNRNMIIFCQEKIKLVLQGGEKNINTFQMNITSDPFTSNLQGQLERPKAVHMLHRLMRSFPCRRFRTRTPCSHRRGDARCLLQGQQPDIILLPCMSLSLCHCFSLVGYACYNNCC